MLLQNQSLLATTAIPRLKLGRQMLTSRSTKGTTDLAGGVRILLPRTLPRANMLSSEKQIYFYKLDTWPRGSTG